MEWYLQVMRNTFYEFSHSISGRARRKEYWMFTLVNFIINLAFAFLIGSFSEVIASGQTNFAILFLLLIMYFVQFLHSIAGTLVLVRRLHDVGKSGWFYFIFLIPIVGIIWLIVLLCSDGQKEDNKWGSNPKT
tara:strand:+ start:241 stop:639 length:399 start_codon:yes stop_codon:yes gene_type:complete